MRQDPNVIMLGEIRDEDTVQMAIQAALIGVLVLSTFHTFDTPALVSRLTEMGATHSVIGQALRGVISSRLIRVICPSCRGVYKIDQNLSKALGMTTDVLQKGRGCTNCGNSGYYGRTGIYEVIYFDDDIKNAIIDGKSPSMIVDLIQKNSIRTYAVEDFSRGDSHLINSCYSCEVRKS